jgi:hypothetical protein
MADATHAKVVNGVLTLQKGNDDADAQFVVSKTTTPDGTGVAYDFVYIG